MGDDHGYSTMTPMSEVLLPQGPHPCIRTDPESSGTDVGIVSPYKMNPSYVRPQTTLGGAPSSSVAASLSTVAPTSEITKQFKFKDQSDLDVTGTLSESESTADKFDIRKDVNNHDSLPP